MYNTVRSLIQVLVLAAITLMGLYPFGVSAQILYYRDQLHLVNVDGSGDIDLGVNAQNANWVDASRILFDDGSNVYMMDVRSQEKQTFGRGRFPALSDDGNWLLVVRNDKLILISTTSRTESELGSGTVPIWIPDRPTYFLYRVPRGFSSDVYIRNIEGTVDSIFFRGGTIEDSSGEPFSAGYQKVLGRTGDDGWFGLHTIDLSTGESRLVRDWATYGAWSPDGRRLAYTRGFTPYMYQPSGLWIVDLASDRETRIIEGTESFKPDRLCWSPDGEWIVLNIGPEGGSTVHGIYLIRPDGTDLHEVARGWRPLWAPSSASFPSVVRSMGWGAVKSLSAP